MALFRLYFVQSLCSLLCLFLERNHFLMGNVDIYAGFIGAHPELPPKPFQEGGQPPLNIPYNDTYYLDLLKSEWCPGIGSCKNPNVISDDTGCCRPCSCSEDCRINGNCCYDKQYSDVEVVMSREICDFTGIEGTEYGSNLRRADSIDDFYLFIDSCGGDYVGIESFKCISPNLQNLTELTPVYDPVSGHNYKNIYCAVCSHVKTPVVRWLPKLAYYHDRPYLRNILQNKELIFENMHLPLGVSVIWIPQRVNFTKCLGQSYFVSACQEPMLTTELLSNLCQSITMPVRYDIYIYKNMYCLLCSSYNFRNCKLYKDPTEARETFAMLLNYDSIPTKNDATLKSPPKCNNDLTYIDELGECLKIYCGCSIMKLKDQCLPVIDNISGISLHFRIKIKFLSSLWSITTLTVIEGFTTTLITTKEFIPQQEKLCFKINTELGEHNMVFDIKVAVKLGKYTLSFQDYYTTFVTKLNLTKVNPSRSSLREIGIVDVSQGDHGLLFLDLEYVNYATFIEETGICGHGVAMTNLQFCNSVRIKSFIYTDNYQINITFSGKNVTFKRSEFLIRFDLLSNDGDVAQICLDTYVSRVSPYVIHQPVSVSSIRETSTLARVILLFVHLVLSQQLIEVYG